MKQRFYVFYTPKGRHIVITLSVCPECPFTTCLEHIPIFFEVRIPNLMCGCIVGLQSVAYRFGVSVTLTLTSVLENSCPEHISNVICQECGIWYMVISLGRSVAHTISGLYDKCTFLVVI